MSTDEEVRAKLGVDMGLLLAKHLGDKPMAAVLVYYQEENQLVNVISNVENKTSIALLADAIKISLDLSKPS